MNSHLNSFVFKGACLDLGDSTVGTVSGPISVLVSKMISDPVSVYTLWFCVAVYKLIAVVVSPAGGALLLILVIALVVTCRKYDLI